MRSPTWFSVVLLGTALALWTGCGDSSGKRSAAPNRCGPSVQSPDDPALEGFLDIDGQRYAMRAVEYIVTPDPSWGGRYQVLIEAVDPTPYGYVWFYLWWWPSPLLGDGVEVTNAPGEPVELWAGYQHDPWMPNYWLTHPGIWSNSPMCVTFVRYGDPGQRLVVAFEGKLERAIDISPPPPNPAITDPSDQVEVRGLAVIP